MFELKHGDFWVPWLFPGGFSRCGSALHKQRSQSLQCGVTSLNKNWIMAWMVGTSWNHQQSKRVGLNSRVATITQRMFCLAHFQRLGYLQYPPCDKKALRDVKNPLAWWNFLDDFVGVFPWLFPVDYDNPLIIIYPSYIHHISIIYPSYIHHISIIYPSYIHHISICSMGKQLTNDDAILPGEIRMESQSSSSSVCFEAAESFLIAGKFGWIDPSEIDPSPLSMKKPTSPPTPVNVGTHVGTQCHKSAISMDGLHQFLWMVGIVNHYIQIWGFPKNRGTPKSSVLMGFSFLNHPIGGTPICGNPHIFLQDGALGVVLPREK